MAIPPTADLILPRQLPAASAVTATDMLVGDNGSVVQRVTPTQIVNAATPLASQAEAEAGTNNNNRMTPLRVAQAISFQAVASATLAADTGATLVGAVGGTTVQAELDGLKQADIDLQDGVDGAQADASAAISTANAASSAVSSVSGIANAALSASSDALDGVEAIQSPSGSTQVGWKFPLADSVDRTAFDKMREFAVTPLDFGAKGDGIVDDTFAFQKAIDSAQAVFLPPNYRFRVTSTIKTGMGTFLFGAGRSSVIVADTVTGPVILTYPGTGNTTYGYQTIKDFTIVGTATCAIAFTHCTNSELSNIHLSYQGVDRFSGVDGFVFEYFWGSVVSRLSTNGAILTGVPFKLNRAVLATDFHGLYTSNLTDYSIVLDSTVQQYSTGTGTGTGRLSIHQFTAQGANKYAIFNRGYTNVAWHSLYTENNQSAFHMVSGTDWAFYRCNFQGIRTATATHDVWIDNETGSSAITVGVSFSECNFHQTKKVIGKIGGSVNFTWCRTTNQTSILDHIERTSETSAAMPVSIIEQGTSNTRFIAKTTTNAWKLANMSIGEASGAPVWNGTIVTPPVTSLTPY